MRAYIALPGSSGQTSYPGSSATRLIVPFNTYIGGLQAWTNMPLALGFFSDVYQRVIQKADLTGFSECRIAYLSANVAMNAGAKLIIKYSATVDSVAANWLDVGTSEVSAVGGAANTSYASSWIPLAPGAKADNFFALMGSGGDGVIDPNYGLINFHVR